MTQTQADDLQWVTLQDFSPGIQQRTNRTGASISPHFVNGAATAEGTFRCVSLPSGGIGPFMGQTDVVTTTPPQSAQTTGQGHFPIAGALTVPSVFGTTQAGNTALAQASFLLALNWSSPDDNRFQMRRIRMYDHPAFDTIDNITQAGTGSLFVSSCGMESTRASTVSVTTPGVPTTAYSWGLVSPANSGLWKMFPSPTTPSSNTPLTISTAIYGSILTTHQNRSVVAVLVSYSNGSTGSLLNNENIHYTNVNLTTIENATAATFGQEVSNSIDFLVSTDASELFMGKRFGGCLLLRGPLDDATVYRLPSVTSPGGNSVVPATSPIGVVYAVTNGGVYAWGGGGTAEFLSANLEDNFWDDTFVQLFRGGTPGRMLTFKNYIFAPHNWFYDYTQKSWWRLDEPYAASDFSISYYNYLGNDGIIATPRGFTSTATPVGIIYRLSQPATSWTWQSQPINETLNKLCDVRQFVLVGQGNGTVTVTLTGIDGTTSTAMVATFDSDDEVQAVRFEVGTSTGALQATHIQVSLDAASDGTTSVFGIDTAAPTVYEWRMGFRERMHLPGN